MHVRVNELITSLPWKPSCRSGAGDHESLTGRRERPRAISSIVYMRTRWDVGVDLRSRTRPIYLTCLNHLLKTSILPRNPHSKTVQGRLQAAFVCSIRYLRRSDPKGPKGPRKAERVQNCDARHTILSAFCYLGPR